MGTFNVTIKDKAERAMDELVKLGLTKANVVRRGTLLVAKEMGVKVE